jgi:hypothetical protein
VFPSYFGQTNPPTGDGGARTFSVVLNSSGSGTYQDAPNTGTNTGAVDYWFQLRGATQIKDGVTYTNAASGVSSHWYPGGNWTPITVNVTGSLAVRKTRWAGAIQSTCPDPHTLRLTVDGVTAKEVTTTSTASTQAPQTASIDVTFDESNLNGSAGKAWSLSIDGVVQKSGVIGWPCPSGDMYCTNSGTGASAMVTWQLPPSTGRTDATVVFNCDGASGALEADGKLTVNPGAGARTLSLTVNGVVKQTQTSVGGSTNVQTLTIQGNIPNVKDGDIVRWLVDGQVMASKTVVLNCTFNAEQGMTFCSDRTTFAQTVSGNPAVSPTPTPTPTPPAPSTPPPTSTPPPIDSPRGTPPTYSPPPGSSLVTNYDDFYHPMKAAVEDAGRGQAVDIGPATNLVGNTENRGQLDSVGTAVEQGTTAVNSSIARRGVTDGRMGSKIAALPTTFGTASQIPLGINNFGFGSQTGINLGEWATELSLLRTFILWLVTVSFFIATVRLFTSSGQLA